MTGESVVAILSGAKTQTRRVIKPQPDANVIGLIPRTTHAGNVLWGNVLGTGKYVELVNRRCPYGKPGDRLYVKEAWRPAASIDGPSFDAKFNYGPGVIYYRADQDDCYAATAWRSPLFMPRWTSRLTLEIVNVKVERVQDISEADVLAEGPRGLPETGSEYWYSEFHKLWDAINARRPGCSWADNPFCWCLSFRRTG